MSNMAFVRVWDKELRRVFDAVEIDLVNQEVTYGDYDYTRRYSTQGYNMPAVLLHYIGREDKKGRKIYEGDILKTDANPQAVKWSEDRLAWVMWLGQGATTDIPADVEVIGNIYENYELLEVPNE